MAAAAHCRPTGTWFWSLASVANRLVDTMAVRATTGMPTNRLARRSREVRK